MKRDTIKTLVGLVIIAIIVVATFLYGNSQRKAQMNQEQQAHKQETSKPQNSTKAPNVAVNSPSVSGRPNNTAPVQSPASNNIQGGGAHTQSPATPSPTPGLAVTGAASGSTAPLPQTGSPALSMSIMGVVAMTTMGIMLRRSRQNLLAAARGAK